MSLERKLERRNLERNIPSDTIEEDLDEGISLKNILIAGFVATAGLTAYKTGALRPVMKKALEFAANKGKLTDGLPIIDIKKYTSKTSVFFTGLKNWSNQGLKGETFDGEFVQSAPESLLRLKYIHQAGRRALTSFSSALYAGAKAAGKRRKANTSFFDNVAMLSKEISSAIKKDPYLAATKEDFDILKRFYRQAAVDIKNTKKDYRDTELARNIRNAKNVQITMATQKQEGRQQLTDMITEDLLETNKLTAKKRAQQIKRNGYRSLTIGDVLAPDGSSNGKMIQKSKNQINLQETGKDKDTASFYDSLESYLKRTTKVNKDGKRVSLYEDWDSVKDLIIDNKIMIDEVSGKIIDTRVNGSTFKSLVRSLATDYKIPVVGFNPLKQLGLDKFGLNTKAPRYGLLHEDSFVSSITGKAGRTSIREVFGDGHVTVINGEAFRYDKESGGLERIAKNLTLFDNTNADRYGLNRKQDRFRKMSNLSYSSNKAYKQSEVEDRPILHAHQSFMRWADIGNQEVNTKVILKKMQEQATEQSRKQGPLKGRFTPDGMFVDDDTFTDLIINPDNIFSGISKRVFDRKFQLFRFGKKEYKFETDINDIFGKNFLEYSNSDGKFMKNGFSYNAIKNGITLKDVVDQNNDKNILDYLSQFFVGRKKNGFMSKNANIRSTYLFGILDNLDQAIGHISNFGFSNESKGSAADLTKNYLLKRALPIAIALQIPGAINYYSQPFVSHEEDDPETGNVNNIGKVIVNKVIKPIDLTWHKLKDAVGITDIAKKFAELTPGSEQLGEMPGIRQLGLTQTTDERKRWMEKGYNAVRKGRFWSLGNTPFTGGKIEYFRPNAYRRINADVKFSNSKYGSREEYYSNSWLPNLINPFAPVNRFILNRNHYDKKHYYDRPYLQTSSTFGNVPIVGPLYEASVGRILEPKRKMHREYWSKNNGFQVNPLDEVPMAIQRLLPDSHYQGGMSGFFNRASLNPFYNKDTRSRSNARYNESNVTSIQSNKIDTAYAIKNLEDAAKIMNSSKQNAINNQVLSNQTTAFINYLLSKDSIGHANAPENTFASSNEIYTTPSGFMQIVDVPNSVNLKTLNDTLKTQSIKSIPGIKSGASIGQGYGNTLGPTNLSSQVGYNVGEQFSNLANVAGLRGFEIKRAVELVTGKSINEGARIIEDSGYSQSFNRSFWDANLGGFGGEFSEIFRRFVQKRNGNTEYVNPIRNTMPSWLPGSSYFTDFLHGDPYTKIANGEERLPGEGYERLHNISINKNLQIDANSELLGASKDTILKHFLKIGNEKTTNARKIYSIDKSIKAATQNQMIESGNAFDKNMEFTDEKNGITGSYDLRIQDWDSPTGQGIMNVKVVDPKEFLKVRVSGRAIAEDRAEVNYAMWISGNQNSNGYVRYVNREDPNKFYDAQFKYSRFMLEKNLRTVNAARNEVYDKMESGEVGRGELYSDIDRYRILADVAPYSDEFRQQKAKMSQISLTEEEKLEVKEINQRVKQQKNPLRIYDYKFKTANLESEYVTVKKVLDNNTFLVNKYGKDHAIKLAGVRINSDYSTVKEGNELSDGEMALKELKKYISKGKRIKISYDGDEGKKFKKDSTDSISAVVHSRFTNVNKHMLQEGYAKEKEGDDSPAAIHARYSNTERLLGSIWERVAHNDIPFIGSKWLNVNSAYESYKKKEVYGKNFQSWNSPVDSFIVPTAQRLSQKVAENPISGIISAAFIGSLFGAKTHSRLIGAGAGIGVAVIGGIYAKIKGTEESDWIPKRRQKERELNEYVDALSYVKNIRLYEQYKQKALTEDKFDVEAFYQSKEAKGLENKLRKRELEDFKKTVKLDFKHRKDYNFKYGEPLYANMKGTQKEIISQINKELDELKTDRTVEKLSENATKALEYRQAAESTMFGYDPGDPIQNLLKALPKKDRQYFKYFAKAPGEERDKILKLVPGYVKRGLQATWGMKVDEKPELTEYFQTHGLPGEDWMGWDENSDMENVKVKLIHNQDLDYGEFDVWNDDIKKARATSIETPLMNTDVSQSMAQEKLRNILGSQGYENVQMLQLKSASNRINMNITHDRSDEIQRLLEQEEDIDLEI